MLETLKEESLIGEIAARENINRTQLQNWKKEFLENVSRVFSQSKTEREAQQIDIFMPNQAWAIDISYLKNGKISYVSDCNNWLV